MGDSNFQCFVVGRTWSRCCGLSGCLDSEGSDSESIRPSSTVLKSGPSTHTSRDPRSLSIYQLSCVCSPRLWLLMIILMRRQQKLGVEVEKPGKLPCQGWRDYAEVWLVWLELRASAEPYQEQGFANSPASSPSCIQFSVGLVETNRSQWPKLHAQGRAVTPSIGSRLHAYHSHFLNTRTSSLSYSPPSHCRLSLAHSSSLGCICLDFFVTYNWS